MRSFASKEVTFTLHYITLLLLLINYLTCVCVFIYLLTLSLHKFQFRVEYVFKVSPIFNLHSYVFSGFVSGRRWSLHMHSHEQAWYGRGNWVLDSSKWGQNNSFVFNDNFHPGSVHLFFIFENNKLLKIYSGISYQRNFTSKYLLRKLSVCGCSLWKIQINVIKTGLKTNEDHWNCNFLFEDSTWNIKDSTDFGNIFS